MLDLGVVEIVFRVCSELVCVCVYGLHPPHPQNHQLPTLVSAEIVSVHSGSGVVHPTATVSSPWSQLNTPAGLFVFCSLSANLHALLPGTKAFPSLPEATYHSISPYPGRGGVGSVSDHL